MTLLLLLTGAEPGVVIPPEPPPGVGIGGGLGGAYRAITTREQREVREWVIALEDDELAAILSSLSL